MAKHRSKTPEKPKDAKKKRYLQPMIALFSQGQKSSGNQTAHQMERASHASQKDNEVLTPATVSSKQPSSGKKSIIGQLFSKKKKDKSLEGSALTATKNSTI